METASSLGGYPGQIVVVCVFSGMLWGRESWGLALPLVMAGAGILQLAAKWAIDRPRPNLDPWGFPSAHVLSLVVLCGYLAYVLATSQARDRWRTLGVAFCASAVGIVAFSRMYLDAHWLSDVLGGFSVGLAYLLAVIWLLSSRLVRTPG
jgi:undecaprenyl-diphosphatase